MVAIGRLLVKWLGSLSGNKFNSVKALAGRTFNIPTTLPKSDFVSAVSAHIGKYPVSYATLLGGLSSYSKEIMEFVGSSGSLSDDDMNLVKAVLGDVDSSAQLVSYEGADGDVDTVNGVDADEFSRNVDLVEGARRNVQEIANILGVSPKSVIELSMRLSAVEPQHIQLFK